MKNSSFYCDQSNTPLIVQGTGSTILFNDSCSFNCTEPNFTGNVLGSLSVCAPPIRITPTSTPLLTSEYSNSFFPSQSSTQNASFPASSQASNTSTGTSESNSSPNATEFSSVYTVNSSEITSVSISNTDTIMSTNSVLSTNTNTAVSITRTSPSSSPPTTTTVSSNTDSNTVPTESHACLVDSDCVSGHCEALHCVSQSFASHLLPQLVMLLFPL